MFLLKVIAFPKEEIDDSEDILSPSDKIGDFKKFVVEYANHLAGINRGLAKSKVKIYLYKYLSEKHKHTYQRLEKENGFNEVHTPDLYQWSEAQLQHQYENIKKHIDYLAANFHFFPKYHKVKIFLKEKAESKASGTYSAPGRYFYSKGICFNNASFHLQYKINSADSEFLRVMIHELGHKDSFESKSLNYFLRLQKIKMDNLKLGRDVRDFQAIKIITEFVEHFARFDELLWGFVYDKNTSKEQKQKLQKAIFLIKRIIKKADQKKDFVIIMNKIWKQLGRAYSFSVIP